MARFTTTGGSGEGTPGATGAPGADGADGTSFLWSDAFDGGTTYPLNYVVSYQGSSYIKVATGGSFPLPTDSDYWSLLAQKGKDSFFLGTWNSETEFLALYQGGPVGLAVGDWWAFVKDNENPNKVYVVREDPTSATGWVIDDNEHFVLPAGADGADGADALWNFTGEWVNGIDYAAGSVVEFQGSTYYHPTGQYSSYSPPTNGWLLVSAKGADGSQGEQGNPGEPGEPGADGAAGSSFGIYYLGNYNASSGYSPNIAVVRGSDGQLYLAKASGQLGDPVGNSAEWEVWIPKGADGSNGTNGTSIVSRGPWTDSENYAINDIVTFEGSAYICIVAVTAGTDVAPYPENIGAYWNLLVSGSTADTGQITFLGVYIIGAGGGSGDGAGNGTIKLLPDEDLVQQQYHEDQYLIIDPTAPNHIHIRAGGNQDASTADLIFGGERNKVLVSDSERLVLVSTRPPGEEEYENQWIFGSDGILIGPGVDNLLKVNGLYGKDTDPLFLLAPDTVVISGDGGEFLDDPTVADNQIATIGDLPTGATGTFTSQDNKTVTVTNGIITSIV